MVINLPSLSKIVTVAISSPIIILFDSELDKTAVNIFSFSTSLSSVMGTVTVVLVLPASNVISSEVVV